MKKVSIVILSVLLLLQSCNSNKHHKGNLTVKGTVKGLRLGTLLLKRMVDDSLQPVDSIKVDGEEKFEFHTQIDQPQMMMLSLPEVKDGKIIFFTAPGDTIKIFTYVESFGINPQIGGGINQEKLAEFNQMIHKFNDKELDLFKQKFDASKNGFYQEADSIGKKMDRLKRKKILYTLNFIFMNKDKAVAPYIALNELQNSKKLIDTVYKTLPESSKSSLYGKQLKQILDQQNTK